MRAGKMATSSTRRRTTPGSTWRQAGGGGVGGIASSNPSPPQTPPQPPPPDSAKGRLDSHSTRGVKRDGEPSEVRPAVGHGRSPSSILYVVQPHLWDRNLGGGREDRDPPSGLGGTTCGGGRGRSRAPGGGTGGPPPYPQAMGGTKGGGRAGAAGGGVREHRGAGAQGHGGGRWDQKTRNPFSTPGKRLAKDKEGDNDMYEEKPGVKGGRC